MAVKVGLLAQRIKEHYKALSLSKTFIDKIAAKWAPKIETDDDIEAYITEEDRADLITETSAEANRVRTEAAAKAKKPADKPAEEEIYENDEIAGATPFEKAMLKQMGELKGKITGFETAQNHKTIAERYQASELLKDIPKGFLKGRALPTTEDEIEAFATQAANDYTEFATEHKLQIIGTDKPGAGGGGTGGNGGGDGGKIPVELQNYAANLKAKDEASVAKTH